MKDVGSAWRRALEHLGNLGFLLFYTFRSLLLLPVSRFGIIAPLVKLQLRFTAWEALPLACGTALMLGAVTLIQGFSQLSEYGAEAYIGPLLVPIIIRELGPLTTAILVIGRSGTAIAAELAAMRLNQEVDALEIMGVDPYAYLLLPRMLGVTISVFILIVLFDFTALMGGFLVTILKHDVSFLFFLTAIRESMLNLDLGLTLLKAGLFGTAIALVACYWGLKVRHSSTEIPQAVTHAVVGCLVAVFITDGLLAIVFYG